MQKHRLLFPAGRLLGPIPVSRPHSVLVKYQMGQVDYGDESPPPDQPAEPTPPVETPPDYSWDVPPGQEISPYYPPEGAPPDYSWDVPPGQEVSPYYPPEEPPKDYWSDPWAEEPPTSPYEPIGVEPVTSEQKKADEQIKAEKTTGKKTALVIKDLLAGVPAGSSAWASYATQLDKCMTMLNSSDAIKVIGGGACLYSLYQSVHDYVNKRDDDEAAARKAKEDIERAAAAARAAGNAAADRANPSEWMWILAGGAVAAAIVAIA